MDSNNTDFKKCNYCGETIPAGSGRCPFCGSILEVAVDNDPFRLSEEKPAGDSGNTQTGPVPGAPDADTAPIPAEAYRNTEKGGYTAGNAESYTGPSYNNAPGYGEYKRPPLKNGLKVFLTIIFTMIPGLGQLAGIITAIIFMNADDDPDRKSFGVAILVASLIMFVLACIGCFIAAVVMSMNRPFGDFPY